MLRARHLVPAGHWALADRLDTITLDHDARHRRRFAYVADGGTAFLLDLAQAAVIADGDGLRLDDGRVIEVRAAAEALVEVTAPDAATLMRLAWHIGNRHLPAELRVEAIRLRDDHVINAMLEGLGATVTAIHAPFTPEGGAYGGHSHGHGHSHDHDHGHHHHHAH